MKEKKWFQKHKKTLYEMLGDIISDPKEFLNRNLSVEELDMINEMYDFQVKEILLKG
ncbi:MAG: hypothetical protein KAU62_06470 [Candidatus Heimdallarchaeota archaeon]|nr:hypothetical protein [Candidatus Heimdallarchaeota archaeon]MCK4610783.1 hypothetical protein [Candidatus Heimdallarchaeota archaeon]